MLTVEDLVLGYESDAVVNKISLSLKRGECLGIVGRNGLGKTTLLKGIAGLIKPMGGRVLFDRYEARFLEAHERPVSFVRAGGLFPYFSVWENARYQVRSHGLSKNTVKDRFRTLTRYVDLPERLWRKHPRELSEGQRRRAELVTVLMGVAERPVLLLDEPFANLDRHIISEFLETLPRLFTEFGTATLFVSHEARHVSSLTTKAYELEEEGGLHVQVD